MVNALHKLAPSERERVSAAVAAAKARTSAHFALVIVPASDRYALYPIFWGAALAVLTLGILALARPHFGVRSAFCIEVAVFVIASVALEWPPLRARLVPRRIKHAHARALAHREFAARILAHDGERRGVVFFVSLAERYAELIADEALHRAAGQAQWDAILNAFTAAAGEGRIADGFVAGVDACGRLLQARHPKTG